MGGLTRPVQGPARPDAPVPPDEVRPLHIVSSADHLSVDTGEVGAMASELRSRAAELQAAAGLLRLVGVDPGLRGSTARALVTSDDTPGLRGELAAAETDALAAADTIDSIAARAEDLSYELGTWAGRVADTEEGTEQAFWTFLERQAGMLLPGAWPMMSTAIDSVVAARAAVGLARPTWVADPRGQGLAGITDDGVRALGRWPTEPLAMLAAATNFIAPGLVPWAVAGGRPVPQGTPPGQVAAMRLVPIFDVVRRWSTTPTGVTASRDEEGVPGLWTLPGFGPLSGGGRAVGASGLLAAGRHAAPAAAIESGSQVRSVGDAIRRIEPLHAESGRANTPHVEVLRTEHADGSTSFVVVVPGTSGQHPLVDQTNMMDNASNIELAAGRDAAVLEGITAALDAAGAQPGDAVGALGHSQGGLAVAAWMSGADALVYDVRASVSLGAPIAHVGAPVAGSHVSIEAADDFVVGLDGASGGHVPPGSGHGSRTTYSVDTITSPENSADYAAGQAHYVDHYAAAWDGVARHRGTEHDVAAVQAEFAALLGVREEGAVTTSVIVELERN